MDKMLVIKARRILQFDWSIQISASPNFHNFSFPSLTKMSSEKVDEIEHEDFSNTAASGASLTYPMQVRLIINDSALH